MNFNRTELWGLLGLSFFALIGTFLRNNLFGFDSYATWACISNGWCETLNFQEGALLIFRLLPDSLIVFKLIMFLSLFFSLLAVLLLIKSFVSKKNAWIALIVGVACMPIIIFEFSKFENELFAFPLLFWAIYFLITKKYVKSVLFFGASLFFWLWIGLIYYFPGSWTWGIIEAQLFSGVLPLFLGIFLVPFIFLVKEKRFWFISIAFLLFGLLSGRLMLLFTPFLFIALGKLLEYLEKPLNGIGVNPKKSNLNQDILNYLIVLAIIMLIGMQWVMIMQPATDLDMDLIQTSIELHEDTNFPIYNDWSFGYWLWHYDYKTDFKGNGTDPDFNNLDKPFIGITMSQDLNQMGCIYEDGYKTFVKTMEIYICE